MISRVSRPVVLGVALLVMSCGDNLKPDNPDASPDANLLALCGNNFVEPNEDCDDGNQVPDVACDETCHFTCGNGRLDDSFGEICDTGIGSGAGACPATCDDGQACTSDLQSGSECTAECVNTPITAVADDDGCCPSGANSTTDNDCVVACGNAVVETGETCDTGIATGPGACPTTCSDGNVCTTDALTNGGTCIAACTATPITLPANDDDCCPPGANSGNDNDCLPGCDNGVVDPGETCDTAIPSGAGSCPTMCNDNLACTTNILNNGGTCTAMCAFPPITMPANGDGCCPPGANANNDSECAPVCPNGVMEPGEQCDDGNMVNGDACTNLCMLPAVPPTAFKFNDLDLRDPHVFVEAIFCFDVTDTALAGFSVNGELQTNIQNDGDGDGFLDLSPTIVFRNFNQTAATQPVEIHFANCTAPNNSTTTCTPGTTQVVNATATFMSPAQCLTFLPGTVRPYSPAITSTGAPCFVTNAVTVTLDLGGIPITLRDARIAGTYNGNPATTLINGLLMGFISETDANNTIIPMSFPVVGGDSLSSLLPGGDPPGPNNTNCAGHSDKDTNNGMMGWWFYLNFPARRVPFNG